MKANQPKVLVPVALLVLSLVLVGNFMTGGQSYSTGTQDLRANFNRDRGKVRLLMLLAPS